MLRRFAEIAFTTSVKEAQRRYAGREHPGGADASRPQLGERERAFIAARDSFYLATVGESGWPYVQHRGGPTGFLKVLDAALLAFADFSGNRQYVSTGNVQGDGRVCLFLMDYAARRRLKIFGRARVVDAGEAETGLLLQVAPADISVCIERVLLVAVEAFDWNCSQHITPRYTESEWRSRIESPHTTTRSEE